jgi:hypothetical protein
MNAHTASPSRLAKRWCFTLNNYLPNEVHNLHTLGESIDVEGSDSICSYLVFGFETAPTTGTPHLQGYLCLRDKARLSRVKEIPGLERAWFAAAAGNHTQASTYCKKGGDYSEWGAIPTQGAGAQWQAFREWVQSRPVRPSLREVWEEYPNLVARNKSAVLECINIFGATPVLVEGVLRPWQQRVQDYVNTEPDDRQIMFVVDPAGNEGKSWLTRYLMSHRPNTQFLSVGKRDDLAFAIDPANTLFLFDIPRGSMQYLQYSVLEQLKNRMVFSTKYQSLTKIFSHNVHVIVFSNEEPDRSALTTDRYKVLRLLSL